MVDLLDDSDEEGKKNEANPAVQNLAPMNLTSEGDEPRRSTRSSRYRSLQHEVGNLSAMFPDSKTKGAVQITLGDLEHLKDGDMLNDQCVDFFLRYIQVETIGKNKPELLERVHFFNSFFYQKLDERVTTRTPTSTRRRRRIRASRVGRKVWTSFPKII